ncbi:MAG: HAMP domain-containing sensor histidine kinase [Baileyella intestinalis]|uniref:HAMP domain-containing sensor histidine kinase n=1 Tax=Baileyella intestinalis TaxID=2606709 RepID=UPI002A762F82|nr:HAMP domain-containing sensor histidine kinase [Baileyella intestinalis]MDY2994619.1 HAMP domain-containing sensor histidine kinase [Baileyella intestinalis]
MDENMNETTNVNTNEIVNENMNENMIEKPSFSRRTAVWAVSSIAAVAAFFTTIWFAMEAAVTDWLFSLSYDYYEQETADVVKNTLKSFSRGNSVKQMIQIAVVMGIVTLAAIVVSIITSGKKSEGKVRLAPGDRCFGEIQVFGGILAGCAYYPAVLLMIAGTTGSQKFLPGRITRSLIDNTASLDGGITWNQIVDRTGGITKIVSPWFALTMGILMVIAITVFELWVIQSITRKLKNRSFWKNTIIGKLLFAGRNLFQRSTKTQLKIMGLALAMIILSAVFPVGTIIAIVLVMWQLPKYLKRFSDIEKAAEQTASGDLTVEMPRLYNGDELDRLSASINSISDATKIAVDKELKNQKMKTDLITNVSHDLKTPLTSMVTYVDLLKNEGLQSENAEEYLDIISQKTERLRRLTLDLFDAAKASSGDLPVEIGRVDLASLASQSVGEFSDDFQSRNLQVIMGGEDSVNVMADGRYLWRVMENLLNNIRKYAMEGTRVYIDLSSEGGMGIISVKNMSSTQLNVPAEELVQRFARGDESRTTEGSGLGLAIAKDLTALMKGQLKITVDGDLFKAEVMLPLAED